ncbi:MAG: hypothetical protein QOE11_1585, partial [Solirubrobacteraceae bacterium]|nr:hypothetical protein [Solirubrobacteraceae bacterium]
METVKILRKLWRRRAVVSVLAALSVLLGLLLTHHPGFPPKSRQYEVGIAGARILIDTPKSQFVEVAPLGAETLGQRANVLSVLMAEGDVKAAIARHAGLAPQDLVAVSESSADSQPATSATPPNARDVRLLKTRVVRDSEGGQLPIIEVETQAPDAAGATRLVQAAVSGVAEYLDSKAAGEQVADRRRLKVSSVGINPGRVERRGPGLLIGLGAGILAFLFGCATILGVSALSRGWREAEASERNGFATTAAERPSDAIAPPVQPQAPAPAPAPTVHAPAWPHPETVVQTPAAPAIERDESGAIPPSAHDAHARPPAQPERLRPRSRLFSALTAGAV